MAKKRRPKVKFDPTSFNFGANAAPKKPRGKKTSAGNRSWWVKGGGS